MLDKKVIRKSLIIVLIILLILIGITFIRRTFSRYESTGESSAGTDMALWVVNEGFTSEDIYIGEIMPIPRKTSDSFESDILNVINGTMTLESLLGDESTIGTYEDYIKKISFSIQNYNEGGTNPLVASVPLRYEIKLTTTTNMPLEYRLYQYNDDNNLLKNTPCVVSDEIITDTDRTCYREIKATPSNSNGNDFFLDNMTEGNNKEKDQFLLLAWLPDQDNDKLSADENYVFADLVEYLNVEIKAEQITSADEE